MTDNFDKHATSLESPATGAFSIIPHDSTPLNEITRALYIGSSGDVTVIMRSGQEVTFVSIQPGTVLPIRAALVKATGTTATGIVGMV